jgi:oxygen-dependent protoporphyrinogen oxidase
MKRTIAVLGGGLSGLTAARELTKRGFDAYVLEKAEEPGGFLDTVETAGVVAERGLPSAVESTTKIASLIDDLDLRSELRHASDAANRKLVFRNGKTHPYPATLASFLRSGLFSPAGKLRALVEPLKGKTRDGDSTSLAAFARRRLGKELLEYGVDPFALEAYAGDPARLAVKPAFPRLFALESKFGGMFYGATRTLKRRSENGATGRVFGFAGGMQTLAAALARSLGDRYTPLSTVSKIERRESGYAVSYNNAGNFRTLLCDGVVSALPAPEAAKAFAPLSAELADALREVPYASIATALIVFKKKFVKEPPRAARVLAPHAEGKPYLFVENVGAAFPERVERDLTAFTLWAGGVRRKDLFERDPGVFGEELAAELRRDFEIVAPPEFVSVKRRPDAIPQYDLGYREREERFERLEREFKGVKISGNFRGGVAFGDVVENADALADRLAISFADR